MSRKPENTFIAGVHRKLPSTYFEKMHNPYRGGTPDVWYSGGEGDLWVEYKYITRIPRSAEIRPELTPLQEMWLNARHDEGRNVAVVLGTPTGGVIYRDKEWMSPLKPIVFQSRLVKKDDIARWIYSQVGNKLQCDLQGLSLPPRTP